MLSALIRPEGGCPAVGVAAPTRDPLHGPPPPGGAGFPGKKHPRGAGVVGAPPDAQPQKRQDARFLTVDFWALVCYSVTD